LACAYGFGNLGLGDAAFPAHLVGSDDSGVHACI
jgi:hypothetical protein